MSVYKEYTKTDHQSAIRLYKKGWGCLRISQVIGCSPSTVKKWVEAAIESGEDIKKHPSPKYSEDFRKKVIEEYIKRDNLSLKKVAEKNGISHHTLHRWLADAGVATRASQPNKYDLEAIAADIESGLKRSDIAAKHGCSESWVYRVGSGDY